jgi:hypothetical protein
MNTPTPNKAEREYLHTLSAGALLPFLQASGFALVVTITAWVIAMALGMMDPHRPAMVVGALSWLWMLNRLFRHWLSLTMPVIVHAAHDLADDGRLNNSNQAPAEDEPLPIITIRLVKEDGHISDTMDLPGDKESLSVLARGLLNGMPFSESMWTGKGKPFSSKTFRALRDVMKARGMAEYINAAEPKQGIRLTDEGRAVMKALALPHSPTDESE